MLSDCCCVNSICRHPPGVDQHGFGDGTVHISISPTIRQPAKLDMQPQHPSVPKLNFASSLNQQQQQPAKPQSLASISTQVRCTCLSALTVLDVGAQMLAHRTLLSKPDPCSVGCFATLQLGAMQQQVLALQEELTAGHESLAAAQKVPTAFNLNDFTTVVGPVRCLPN